MRVGATFAWEEGRGGAAVRELLLHSFLRPGWLVREESAAGVGERAGAGFGGARVLFDSALTFSDAGVLCETFASWGECRHARVTWRAGYVLDGDAFLSEGFG